MLIGRDAECARVDALLDGARGGTAGVLVLAGEPGIGKTALLRYAEERAEGMQVLRAVGLEAEAELEFSALFDICRPLLALLGELSERQREALEVALGLTPGEPAEGFLTGAATLELLAAAADLAPVLLVLDDAQWLDAASAHALWFASRRLLAERVAVLVAVREQTGRAQEFDTLRLTGLSAEAVAAVLTRSGGTQVPAPVAQHLLEATGGNPLALVELAGRLPPRQLEGAEPVEEPVPVGPLVQQVFAERALALPGDAYVALLVAAVSLSTRITPVLQALDALGVDAGGLEAAEDADLIRVEDGAITFRHPLARSAIVHGASSSHRRRAHRALAGAADAPDARAHHLAAAALGPDEQAAAELAASGRRMRARSGWASAARTLERAARLSPAADARHARLAEAAEAALVAGQIERTLALTDELLAEQRSPGALRLRSRIELHCGDVRQAFADLLEFATLAERGEAAGALADAVEAAELLGEPAHAVEVATRAAELETSFMTELAMGQALQFAGRYEEAAGHLERALERFGEGERGLRDCTRVVRAAVWLGRPSAGAAPARRNVELAREQGAFGPLAHALDVAAELALLEGRWQQAAAHASEGLAGARESRCAWASVRCLEHLAWLAAAQGHAERCEEHGAEAEAVAAAAGFRSAGADRARGLLALGQGRADAAAEALDTPFDRVEALVRAGRDDEARAAAEPTTGPVATRCRALLVDADDLVAPALALDEDDVFARARVQLLHGERLRRAGRRVDARPHLRAAHATFTGLAAEPWARRAAAELRATGERLRSDAQVGDELTPQELQVALLVAEGATNKEAGAALFLSPKTVDFHLRRVFRKLDINSRGELIKRFAADPR